MRLTLLALAATAVATSNAGAQFPPTKLTNRKYFSKKLPVRSLTDSMRQSPEKCAENSDSMPSRRRKAVKSTVPGFLAGARFRADAVKLTRSP